MVPHLDADPRATLSVVSAALFVNKAARQRELKARVSRSTKGYRGRAANGVRVCVRWGGYFSVSVLQA